eukprot:CAMPEP_0182856450 /NCGR_PEP_ID=MMETSP0034_2-20130328/2437_1 /TAXON_ID=156128 /ORGANISM="Nephroselmis pyriformis, Strain CCMP717" /LENGTH=263 /DNA_ID=CAMNT_0024987527 /DNA_START=156 /DNA_END=947 /DNA_ORIENTATION=-
MARPAVTSAVLAVLAFAVVILGVEAASPDCSCDPPGKLCFHFKSSPYRIGPEACNVLCEDPPSKCSTDVSKAQTVSSEWGVLEWTSGGGTGLGTTTGDVETSIFNDPTDELGLRFDIGYIPQGAHIISATIKLTKGDSAGSATNPFSAEVHGVAEDSASAWDTAAKPSSKPLTGCSEVWTAETTGQDITSPNLAKVVQQIVDRAGYSPNGFMSFVLTDGGNSGARTFKVSEDLTRRRNLLVIVPASVEPELSIDWVDLNGCNL